MISSYLFSNFSGSYRDTGTMPAQTSPKFRCFCIVCTASYGTGPDGTPLGNWIPESQRISHLARAKAETEAQIWSQESHLQNATASLFASTLVDDGPNPHAQPSRLWTSHEEYQSSASKPSRGSEALPIDTIIESFQCLQRDVQDSTPIQSVSQSAFPSESDALPLNDIIERFQHLGFENSTPVHPMQSAHPSGSSLLPDVNIMEANTLNKSTRQSKREHSHLMTIAHHILNHVENRTSHWLLQLAAVTSPLDALADAETDIGCIQAAFDSVKRDVHSVNVWKTTIDLQLSQLQSHLVELHRLYPYVDDKPLQYNSGMCFLCIEVNIELKTTLRSSL